MTEKKPTREVFAKYHLGGVSQQATRPGQPRIGPVMNGLLAYRIQMCVLKFIGLRAYTTTIAKAGALYIR